MFFYVKNMAIHLYQSLSFPYSGQNGQAGVGGKIKKREGLEYEREREREREGTRRG